MARAFPYLPCILVGRFRRYPTVHEQVCEGVLGVLAPGIASLAPNMPAVEQTKTLEALETALDAVDPAGGNNREAQVRRAHWEHN